MLATGIEEIKSWFSNKALTLLIYCSLPNTPNLSLISFLYSFVLVFSAMYLAISLGLGPTLNIPSIMSFFNITIWSARVSPVIFFDIVFILLGNTFFLLPVGCDVTSKSGWVVVSGEKPFSCKTSVLICLDWRAPSLAISIPTLLEMLPM